ncbi:MAG TPA: CPBP family intramembrane glutamic endopeptidase [Steroidobacteraceae bacterium]|nr:CPBP family intramembrane glutamic endopeptidase [Steroidobacteraceae bacterium]
MNRLHEVIRELPPGVEFLVVITWAFGLPICASIMSLGVVEGGEALVFNDTSMLGTIILEVIQLAILSWFLRIRGWTLEKFGLAFSWRGTALGLGLLVLTTAIAFGVGFIARIVFDYDVTTAFGRQPKMGADLSMQLIFLVSVVNGIFEELFVAGYIITALSGTRGMWVAINVSVVVRLLCYISQGPVGVVTMVPMGLLYGYAYSRTRQLWPLMVAHVVMDLIGLTFQG